MRRQGCLSLMATWVRNSELQLECGLLWTPRGGRTLTLALGLGRLLTLGPFWAYSQALSCVASGNAVLGDPRGILECSDLAGVRMMAGHSS